MDLLQGVLVLRMLSLSQELGGGVLGEEDIVSATKSLGPGGGHRRARREQLPFVSEEILS